MKIDTSTGELTPLDIDEFHENLPDEMLQAQRWLLWEERPNPDPTKKPLKVPYYAAGTPRGATDTPEDAARLVSFDDAFDAYINNLGKYNGIGFALGNDGTGNCWQGIDFDGLSKHQKKSCQDMLKFLRMAMAFTALATASNLNPLVQTKKTELRRTRLGAISPSQLMRYRMALCMI
jgi:hypothetical protein